jgi:hypothetical protein
MISFRTRVGMVDWGLVVLPGVKSGGAPSEFTPLEIFAVVGHYVVLELMMD